MKSQNLWGAIGEIDENMIREAETAKLRKIKPWYFPAGIAAAAAVGIAAVLLFPKEILGLPVYTDPPAKTNQVDQAEPKDYSNLPKLNADIEYGGMGGGGSISKYAGGNPWTIENDGELTELPVFKRTFPNPTPEEMLSLAENTAKALRLKIENLYTLPTEEQIRMGREKLEYSGMSEEEIEANLEPYSAVAECEGGAKIFASVGVSVELTPETFGAAKNAGKIDCDSWSVYFGNGYTGVPLPSKYNFKEGAPESEAWAAVEYLLSEYGGFIEFKNPGRSHSYYNFGFFENSGSLLERMTNYYFGERIDFSPTETDGAGELSYIGYSGKSELEKIGDYPIITAAEAREKMLRGEYIAYYGPESPPKEKNIADTELVYISGTEGNTCIMPYYSFLVFDETNGTRYGHTLYIPAVREDFLITSEKQEETEPDSINMNGDTWENINTLDIEPTEAGEPTKIYNVIMSEYEYGEYVISVEGEIYRNTDEDFYRGDLRLALDKNGKGLNSTPLTDGFKDGVGSPIYESDKYFDVYTVSVNGEEKPFIISLLRDENGGYTARFYTINGDVFESFCGADGNGILKLPPDYAFDPEWIFLAYEGGHYWFDFDIMEMS